MTNLQRRFAVIVLRYLKLFALRLLDRNVTTDLFDDADKLINELLNTGA